MREEDMSNISNGWADTEDKHNLKCPMCGADGWTIEYPDDNGSGWFCNNKDCSFSCNPEDLPKMVAAMDLARKHKKLCDYKGYDPNKVTDLVCDITLAEHRVCEVFK